MTDTDLERRVTRLEQRTDQLDGVIERLERIETRLNEHGAILIRMLATLDSHDRTLREILVILPRLGFRWPWEARA